MWTAFAPAPRSPSAPSPPAARPPANPPARSFSPDASAVDYASARRSEVPCSCRAGLWSQASEGVDCARAQARLAHPRVPDRFGECARAGALRAGVRAAGALSGGGAGRAGVPAPRAVRVLGARGLPAAALALSAAALPHGPAPRLDGALPALDARRVHGEVPR